MGFSLYPYQKEAVDAWLKHGLSMNGYSGLIVLPTGSGKTVVGASLAAAYIATKNENDKVLWLVHREELKEQALKSFRHQGLNVTVWDANVKDITGDIIVVMKDSARGMYTALQIQYPFGWNIICLMIDEAHHEAAQSYKNIEAWAIPEFKLGFTATPTRLDEKPLDFNKIVYQLNFLEVVQMGFLASPIYIRFKTSIQARLHSRSGDFVRAELSQALDIDERNQLIVNEYISNRDQYGKTLLFAIDVEHAQNLSAAFDTRGVLVAIITGKTPLAARAAVVDLFRKGGLDILINVEIAIEGFDVEDIKSVFLCRPTQSEVYYMQMIGRGARRVKGIPADKDNFYIVDFIDGSNHYARVADKWAQEHFNAEPDMEMVAEFIREEDVNEYKDFLRENGMSVQRKEIQREVYIIDGILKCTNKSGKTKRLVLNTQERLVVDRYIQYVQSLQNVRDYSMIMKGYFRQHKIGRHFHRLIWASIAWAVFWKYIKGMDTRNNKPVLEYIPFQLQKQV